MKRFAKAFSLLVAVAVTAASLATPVSAAVSSVEQNGVPGVESVEGISADEVTITSDATIIGAGAEVLQTAKAEALAASSANELVDMSAEAAALGVDASQFQVTDVFDIYIPSNPAGNTVTIDVKAGLTPGAYYMILHYVDGGWVKCNSGYADAAGNVKIVSDTFSPFAIVTVSDTVVTTTTATAEESGAKTSPQTGETANAAIIAAIALAAAATVVAVSGKKVTR